jgi:palmitoyltransferase
MRVTGIFVILCFVFTFITLAFTTLQLWYIYLGVTTNEADKWSDIEYLVKRKLLYSIDMPINDEKYAEKVIVDGKPAFISLKDDTILIPSEHVQNHRLRQVVSVEKDLINIYDHGFWNNLKERVLT